MASLSRLIDDYIHLVKPNQAGDKNMNAYTLNKHPHQMFDVCIKFQKIYKELNTNQDKIKYFLPKNFHYMPPGGAYGWHDILDVSHFGDKVLWDLTYLLHCEEHNKTIIKYLKGDDIYEVQIAKGWSAFQVKVGTWHCIESHTNTLMMAFRPSQEDNLGFCDENHYAAEKFQFRNF